MKPSAFFTLAIAGLWIFTPPLLIAQDSLLRCELIAQEDGLPDNSAWSLCEDHLGLLWVGTQLGLARYDGHTVEVFDFEPPDPAFRRKMPINVRTLTEGPSGDLWIGTAHGEVFRFDRQTLSFIPYFSPSPHSITVGPRIQKILVDSAHRVWLAMGDTGLARLQASADDMPWRETARTLWHRFPQEGDDSPGKIVWDLATDQHGGIWAATDRGLAHWNEKKQQFQIFPLPEYLTKNRDLLPLTSLDIAPDGNIWLAAPGAGLIRFFPDQQRFELHPVSEENLVFKVYIDRQGKPWLMEHYRGSEKVSLYDPVSRKVHRRTIWDSRHFSTSIYHDLRDIIEDRNGLIWIADHFSGLLKHRRDAAAFQWVQHNPATPNSLGDNAVTCFFEGSRGYIWIATRGKGLDRWDPRTNTFVHLRHQPGNSNTLSSDNVFALTEDKRGRLWIGTDTGIDRYDPLTNTLKRLNEAEDFPDSLKNINVNHLQFDEQGACWIASNTLTGLHYFNPESGIHLYGDDFGALTDSLRSTVADEFFIDSRGKLWVGTNDDGFYYFDPVTSQTRKFDFPPGGDFWEDKRQTIWVGTYGSGLVGVDMHDLSWRQFTTADGLPHSKVRSIMHDRSGRLWVGTNHGLSHFNPVTKEAENFFIEDGLPSNEFLSKTHLRLKDGRLLFGTKKGLIFSHPDSIQRDTARPAVVLLDLKVDGRPLAEVKNDATLNDVSSISRLELRYDQNDLAFRYAAMNFRNPERNRYQVKLEPYDDEWQETDNRTSYTNLDPGQYTFRVKAANSDGAWNDRGIALGLTILPPWWETGWAYALYLLIISAILYTIYYFQLQRKLEKAEAYRLQELNDFKGRFYTNITHEFRTPLTIIQGVTQQLEDNDQPAISREEAIKMIRRNNHNLLTLVNQMLDLSKLETGAMPLKLVQNDIIPFLSYMTESFTSLAVEKNISLTFYSEVESLVMDYDPEKMQQILGNLLSNAIKFTPQYGKVMVIVKPGERTDQHLGKPGKKDSKNFLLGIQVKDTGIGIPKPELSQIFDRFHQVDGSHTREGEGTGIGLALTQELVKLLDGTIEVDSEVEQGTTFSVYLPVRQEAAKSVEQEGRPVIKITDHPVTGAPEENPAWYPSVTIGEKASKDRPSLLIIEDNRDVVRYLQTILQKDYRIHIAYNGRVGIEKAISIVPDIIISDVMMPEKDGYEVCRVLKSDERSSHIPIILLTAKADAESRLEGLGTGADAYLAKPFLKEELELHLRNLIELRRRLQKRYSNHLTTKGVSTIFHTGNPREDAFLQRLYDSIETNIGDENFGVAELTKAMHLSRTQLHRKVKALTGHSSSLLIRTIRLHQARELLRTTDMRIGEVAYAVGFRDPSYFTRVYKETFGEVPSGEK